MKNIGNINNKNIGALLNSSNIYYEGGGKTLNNIIYPVGAVIIRVDSTNPATWYGGTWELLCPGRTLVCINTSDGDFNTVKKTGGEKTHKLTVNEMPSHNHQYEDITGNRSLNGQFGRSGYYESEAYMGVTNSVIAYADADFRMTYVGGSESHNNLQPYMVVYIWVRTA